MKTSNIHIWYLFLCFPIIIRHFTILSSFTLCFIPLFIWACHGAISNKHKYWLLPLLQICLSRAHSCTMFHGMLLGVEWLGQRLNNISTLFTHSGGKTAYYLLDDRKSSPVKNRYIRSSCQCSFSFILIAQRFFHFVDRYVRQYFYEMASFAALEAVSICSHKEFTNRMKMTVMFPEMNPSMDSYRWVV